MTRIKAISVLAVAFALTAFGASGAFAWEATISAEADCHTVTVTAHDKDGSFRGTPTGDLTFKQKGHADVPSTYTFDTGNPAKDQTIDTVDATDLGPGDWTVVLNADKHVKAKFNIPTCESPSPTPTETASPSASPSPTETASPAPTETASPTATPSATASVQPTSTSVPSPPVTGQGSGGGGDNTFGIALLVMVIGTVVVGGTTLALSRKGS